MAKVNRKLMILEALVNVQATHLDNITTKILAEACDVTELHCISITKTSKKYLKHCLDT